ncbi:MAG: hypothetical protein H6634_18430 [Anaerolineales bacterium]|nr:hypothetical protein [Anaerolineales bacterium]
MKKIFWIIVVFSSFLFIGCSPIDQAQMSLPTSNLQITNMKISVGSAKKKPDAQVVSYDVTIHNSSSNAITVAWAEPVLENSVSSRVSGQSLLVTIGKTIAPNSSLVINGSFIIDTTGLTKSDMKKWRYIDLMKLSSEETIPVPVEKSQQ